MLARWLSSPESGHYVQQLVWKEDAGLGEACIRRAWEIMAARHDALRLAFVWEGGAEPRQFVRDAVEVSVVSLRMGSDAGPTSGLEAFLRSDRARGFDPSSAPLWRVTRIDSGSGRCDLVWSFHHLLLDGRSHTLVFEEWRSVCEALARGGAVELPRAHAYSEFLEWLERRSVAPAVRYWAERLAGFAGAPGLPTLALDADDVPDSGDNAESTVVLGAEESEALRRVTERRGISLNNLVQAAWAIALARYNGVEDITFGSVRSGRHWGGDEPEKRVGLFIDTVPFRVEVKAEALVWGWLDGLRRQQVAVRVAEHLQREEIRKAAGLKPREWLFRTVVMFEGYDPHERLGADRQGLAGERGAVELLEKIDVPTLAVYAGKRVRMVMSSPARLHPEAQLRCVLAQVRRILAGLAEAGEGACIGDLGMASPEELGRMLTEWQGPVVPLPERPFHRLLEEQAARTPEAAALEFEGREYGYGALHAWANRMARRFREHAAPGDRLCVILDRSPEQVAVWLAAMKAGLVYAPVDPGNPPQRMEFFLRDLSPRVVVTQRAFVPGLPREGVRILCLDDPEEQKAVAGCAETPLAEDPEPEAACCILYTSGSTGMPKGSVLTHRGMRHFWVTLRGAFDIGAGDRVLLANPTSFDASLWDMAQALQTGAVMVGTSTDRLATGPALAETLETCRITAFMPTPTRLRDLPLRSYPALRWILPAGEVLPASLVERWGTGRRVMNIFGPTECTVWATGEECRADGTRPVVGRLRENVRAYVLDDQMRPVPVGVPGQLFIGGSGVGAGYWNRPELTAERFVPDPFVAATGAETGGRARMYRTGDRVRWLWDGRLDFIERFDHQVKYRGARIELGEIEANLASHPQVEAVAVVLAQDQLAAWVVPAPAVPAPTADALRAWLAERIQFFFIPTSFRLVAELPRTISGKVDRAALAERVRSATEVARRDSDGSSGTGDGSAAETALPGKRVGDALGIPEAWSRCPREFPRDKSVVEMFWEQVVQRPGAAAIEDGGRVLDYGTLDRLSDAVAGRLMAEGIGDEEAVGVMLERSWKFVVAILGVLKAGGSYVPMGVEAPAPRVAYLLEDSGVRWLLTDGRDAARVGAWKGRLVSCEGLDAWETTTKVSAVAPRPSRRAYIIYTSGSTGQPKGVEVEHHSLTNLVWHYRERLELRPGDRATQLAHVTFDASVADIWPSLCTGGTLLIPAKEVLADVDELMAWLVSSRATFTFVATALAEVMLARPWPAGVSLRHFATGGDTLHVRPSAELPFTVWNTYGPTENTVDSTWSVVRAGGEGAGRPAIGRPIANVRVYVLTEEGREADAGQAGELVLGGEQVARGYLGRPELTAEKFPRDPFSDVPGARMYRTGDWARWTPDGELEFLGRRDDQIQIRGRRVELGEIEAALRGSGRVGAVCCVPEMDGHGISGVVAHVVPVGSGDGLEETLKAELSEQLPAYMIPGRIVVRDALPMTAAGKVDRVALRKESGPAPVEVALNPEGDGLEQALLRLWWQLFPTARGASKAARFWELGGDSLMAIRLVLGVQEITGVRMPVSSFLLDPTLGGLNRAVRAQMEQGAASRVLALRRRGARPPLFCVYAVGGDVGVYFALADALGEDQPVFGIRSPAAGDRAEELPKTLEAAAADVIRWIRTIQPEGPPAVVGYSFGGMLAFEVGRQLVAEGGEAPFIAVLGTHPPICELTVWEKAAHFLRWIPYWIWRTVMDRRARQERLGRLGGMARRAKENFQEAAGALPAMPSWARHPIVSGNIELALHYRPKPGKPLVLDLFRERKTHRRHGHPLEPAVTTHLPDGGWGRWAGATPRVHWLDTSHEDVYRQPGVQELAATLRAAMDDHARRRASGR